MNDVRSRDEYFMSLALEEAKKAAAAGEVPVGAVVVRNGEVIAKAFNLRECRKNALCHAETLAINRACGSLGGWRLPGCELYVTLECCPMCAGACVNSRIERVVYGAKDPKSGALGSVADIVSLPLNHRFEVKSGVLENECSALLGGFFARLRKKKESR